MKRSLYAVFIRLAKFTCKRQINNSEDVTMDFILFVHRGLIAVSFTSQQETLLPNVGNITGSDGWPGTKNDAFATSLYLHCLMADFKLFSVGPR